MSLQVASIGVRARLVAIGLGAGGALRSPANASTPGWYDAFPRPGQIGPAVIVGHGDLREGRPGVFHRLGQVRPGDHIVVTRADGSVVTFTVDEVRDYSPRTFPTSTVYGVTPQAELRLITFDATVPAGSPSHPDIVVFASLTGSVTPR